MTLTFSTVRSAIFLYSITLGCLRALAVGATVSPHIRCKALAVNFLLLHLGAATRALIVIKEGRIVDGIGRSDEGMGTASRAAANGLRASLGRGVGRSRYAGEPESVEARLREARSQALWERVEKESSCRASRDLPA